MNFARLKELCEKNKVSFCKLERELGIANGTLSRWETSSPRVDNLKKVCDFFGVTTDDLLKEED